MNINDHISIKGVDSNDPNSEGRVVEVTDKGVYIVNSNMPFMGTYNRMNPLFVPNDKIISK